MRVLVARNGKKFLCLRISLSPYVMGVRIYPTVVAFELQSAELYVDRCNGKHSQTNWLQHVPQLTAQKHRTKSAVSWGRWGERATAEAKAVARSLAHVKLMKLFLDTRRWERGKDSEQTEHRCKCKRFFLSLNKQSKVRGWRLLRNAAEC